MARGSSFARSSVQSAGGCREDWLNVGNLELISGLIGGSGGGGRTGG